MEDPAGPESNPFDRVVGPWERVLDDMAATASEYRDAGYTVVECHPGDVTVLTGEARTLAEQQEDHDPGPRRLGFDVVLPGDEFENVQSALGDEPVDRYEVFAARGNGMVFLLVALERGDDVAVLVPLYYEQTDRPDLEQVAEEEGLYTHLRPLVDDDVLSVAHADPDPFFPD